jgi:ferrous iron transport protein B
MGLTSQSTGKIAPEDIFYVKNDNNEFVIALAGNPNTGKSTVFNYLTGLKQHTGNWPGKTVSNARGEFNYNNNDYILVDLPGTYSLFTSSQDEAVAKEFICYGNHDAVIVVADATCIERNLNLVFQVMEITSNVILCLNLIDEAEKKNIRIDKERLENELGIPVVLTAARNGTGMKDLKKCIENIAVNKEVIKPHTVKYNDIIEKKVEIIMPILEKYNLLNPRYIALRILDGDNTFFNNIDNIDVILSEISEVIDIAVDKSYIREEISKENYVNAKLMKDKCVIEDKKKLYRDKKIDDVLTSKNYGIPIMLCLLGIVLWITIQGANYPSKLLSNLLFGFENVLTNLCIRLNVPEFIHGIFILGLYRTLAWVIAVMLPPMAIFFPLFTLLEDLGYLPRVAFNLDHKFKKACAHGKQCLCMCMGLGCNAAGIIGCRIIDSPREKMIAILTNNFMPCNGRFPTLIAISSVFFAVTSYKALNSFIPALAITLCIIFGVGVTLLVSYILSKTLLKGVPSTFTLELPPYRAPKIGRVIYSSIIDRTLFVLGRAIIVAAPAGAATWLISNIMIGDMSILNHVASFLQPFANLMGLDGFILMAFIVGLPANEIVLPVLLMAYLSTGSLIEFESISQLKEILVGNGWTYLTALNTILFSLLHWPCSTTLMTIKKETGSRKWTFAAFMIPTVIAVMVCMCTTAVYRLIF